MPEYLAPAVANEFVRKNRRPLPQMKLQKLTYMAHGWGLAIMGEPLVREQPEAWDNGPVYRRIWDRIRDFGLDQEGFVVAANKLPYIVDLISEEEDIIDHVWRRYRRYDADELSSMTHQPGTPWTRVYFGRGRNAPIPNNLIERHYRDLAFAGRPAA